MLFVVDSNILFTYFWNDSVFRKIRVDDVKFISPEFSLSEIKKHSSELKTSLSKSEFNKLREELTSKVSFVPLEEYNSQFKEVLSATKHIPEEQLKAFLKDVDFIALALKLNCPIWSNDGLLKGLSLVEVLSTREVVELLELAKDS